MNTNMLTTIIIVIAALIYICYKQCAKQPVSLRDFILPAIGAVYFGLSILNGTVSMNIVTFEAVGAVIGILTGLTGGQIVQVWRDASAGIVYQRGGWNYVLVLLGLLAVRVLIYVILYLKGDMVLGSFGALNYAFIALAIGNYLGRSINVHMRAARLNPQLM
ncbi:MAG TPA: hypothetical protein VJ761_03725 [Ktedonobacteraceae bacterium]|nr:hypothetical protein [Ktedonobacteraceae bacterium]